MRRAAGILLLALAGASRLLRASDDDGVRSWIDPRSGHRVVLFPRSWVDPDTGHRVVQLSTGAERLVNLSEHDYSIEPNGQFSPDGKWLIFRSNLHGPIEVYAVEVAKAR